MKKQYVCFRCRASFIPETRHDYCPECGAFLSTDGVRIADYNILVDSLKENLKKFLAVCGDEQSFGCALQSIFDVIEEEIKQEIGMLYGQCKKPQKGKLVNISQGVKRNEENNNKI